MAPELGCKIDAAQIYTITTSGFAASYIDYILHYTGFPSRKVHIFISILLWIVWDALSGVWPPCGLRLNECWYRVRSGYGMRGSGLMMIIKSFDIPHCLLFWWVARSMKCTGISIIWRRRNASSRSVRGPPPGMG